jgi:Uma2 family endonuclease
MGKKILARLVEALTEELSISLFGLGNTTFRRKALARGLEPDECYYLCERLPLHDPHQPDAALDAAPDLVLEVEISRSVLDRMAIYAALGVPETWCTNGDWIRVYQLQAGHYVEVGQSISFPWLPMADLASFLRRRGEVSDTQLVKEFRLWVRTTIAPRLQTPGP